MPAGGQPRVRRGAGDRHHPPCAAPPHPEGLTPRPGIAAPKATGQQVGLSPDLWWLEHTGEGGGKTPDKKAAGRRAGLLPVLWWQEREGGVSSHIMKD